MAASIWLDPFPEQSLPIDVTVTPASYANVNAMIAANPSAQVFGFSDGDYSSWGKTILNSGGNASARMVFRHVSSIAPWSRVGQAVVPSFDFREGGSYVVIWGIRFEGVLGGQNIIRAPGNVDVEGAHDVLFHQCWFDAVDTYCVRMHSSNNTVQYCVAEEMESVNDGLAFQISAVALTGAENNKVLNCRIRNWNDCIGVTDHPTDFTVEVKGTVFDENDMYQDGTHYSVDGDGNVTTPFENFVDIKTGSWDSKTYVTNNRMWGTRSLLGTSSGAAMVFHNAARNIECSGNIIYDCVMGLQEEVWHPVRAAPFKSFESRLISYNNNILHGIRKHNVDDFGVAFRSKMSVDFENNTISDTQELFWDSTDQDPDRFKNNRILSTPSTNFFVPKSNFISWMQWNDFVFSQKGPDLSEINTLDNIITGHETGLGATSMTATTTFEIIREQQESLIQAISPSVHSSKRFVVERGESKFRDWAEQNPEAAFRRFSIRRVGPTEPGEVSGLTVEEMSVEAEIVIAYPRNKSFYGSQAVQDMDDLIESDDYQIRNAVGSAGYSSWVAGQTDAFEVSFVEEGESVDFLVLSIELKFYRGIS